MKAIKLFILLFLILGSMSLAYGGYTYGVARSGAATSYEEPPQLISVPPRSSNDLLGGLLWMLSAGDNIRIRLLQAYSSPVGLNWNEVHLNLTVRRVKNINHLYIFDGGRLYLNYTSLERIYTSNFTLTDWSLMPNSTVIFRCEIQGSEYYYTTLDMINTDNTSIVLGSYDLQITYFDNIHFMNTAQLGIIFLVASVIPFSLALLLPLIDSSCSSRRKRRKGINMTEGGQRLELRRPEEARGKNSGQEAIETYGREFSVVGSTLKVYWLLLCKRGVSTGLREIQREVGFSSPSSAVYQLEKLTRLGLVKKDEMGDYVVQGIAKIGFLRNFLFFGTHAFPKDLIYCILTLLANSVCISLLLSMGLSSLAYLALLPGMLSSIVFLYEGIRTWNYKQKMTETVEQKHFETK